MTILKNGSTLLLEILTSDGSSVVLAQTENDFVTWRKDDQGDTYSGHYSQQTLEGLKEAIADLEARAID